MKISILRGLCGLLLGLALAIVFAPQSEARMGGGHSYSGGSSGRSSSSGSSSRSGGFSGSSRSSGGGGGWGGIHWNTSPSSGYSSHYGSTYVAPGTSSNSGGEFVLVEIIVLILVIYILYRLLTGSPTYGKTKTFQASRAQDFNLRDTRLDEQLAELQARDENFSKILFLDFASLLYHKFYTFRGKPQFTLLRPYLSPLIIESTVGNAFYRGQTVHGIVIGKARISQSFVRNHSDNMVVEFEANLSLRYQSGENVRFANQEQWTFARQTGVLSPQPEKMRSLSCPSCGAPADFTDAGECQHCHTFIQAGEKQWQVVSMKVINTEPFKAENPAAYVEESGTELPTLKQADLFQQQQMLLQNHGLFGWDGFFDEFRENVVKPYFLATYTAWSQGHWREARHLVSDRLYESNNFWMQEYARQGWHNRLDNIQIHSIVPARIDLDKFYESITVRVFASCLDYTVDKNNKLIGGSAKKPRKFSEYWTFVRTAGARDINAGFDLKTCPSCGAPADKMGQAGECGYCGSKLSEGRFSWVLAIITQDEAYEG